MRPAPDNGDLIPTTAASMHSDYPASFEYRCAVQEIDSALRWHKVRDGGTGAS